jgi:hypothetical protein
LQDPHWRDAAIEIRENEGVGDIEGAGDESGGKDCAQWAIDRG